MRSGAGGLRCESLEAQVCVDGVAGDGMSELRGGFGTLIYADYRKLFEFDWVVWGPFECELRGCLKSTVEGACRAAGPAVPNRLSGSAGASPSRALRLWAIETRT